MEEKLVQLTKQIEKEPNNRKLYKERGNIYYKLCKDCSDKSKNYYSKAVSDYTAAIKLDLESGRKLFDVYRNRANVLRDLGEFEKSFKDYEEAITLAKRNKKELAKLYEDLGNAHFSYKSYDAAIENYNKSIKEFGNDRTSVYVARAGVYYRNNNIDKALEDYETAVKKAEKTFEDADKAEKDDAIKQVISANESYGNFLCYKGSFEDAIACFNKILEIDEKHVFGYINRGNAYLQMGDSEKAKWDFKKAMESEEVKVEAYINYGNLLLETQKLPDALEAEEMYSNANKIDSQNPKVCIGMGNALYYRKKFNDALKWYEDAIRFDSNNENSHFAYHGLAQVYKALNEFDNATVNCEESIKLNPEFAEAHLLRGNIYFENRDIEKAIESYKKSIDLKPKFVYAYSALAKALYMKGDEDAKEEVKDICEKAKSLIKGDAFRTQQLDMILKRIEPASSGISPNLDELMKKINKKCISTTLAKEKRSFTKFISADSEKTKPKSELEFVVLRRWNSYTPIMSKASGYSRGGGYFIKTEKTGIIVDPGFDFIRNFLSAGYVFKDIDHVFISHAHNDHTADLESLLTLLHKYNDEIKGVDDYENTDTIFYDLIIDGKLKAEDSPNEKKAKVSEAFRNSERRKKINLYMTLSTFKKYTALLDLYDKNDYTVTIIRPGIKLEPIDDVGIKIIKASHDDLFSDINSVGLIFSHGDFVLVYTGDTGFNDDIEAQYGEIKTTYKENDIVLLAHIGGFEDFEENYTFDIKKSYYKNHLGRLGIARLAEILNPRVCIISEFGEEFQTSRKKLCDIFNEVYSKKGITFFPADIGFRINEKNSIYAIKELNNSNHSKFTEGYIPADEVKAIDVPAAPLYYCSKNINEQDFLKKLLERNESA